MNAVQKNGDLAEQVGPYWLPHLCELAGAVERAEERRVQAKAALAESEVDLDGALMALYDYYSKLPNKIPITNDALERLARIAAIWLRRTKL